MPFKFNPITGELDLISGSGGGDSSVVFDTEVNILQTTPISSAVAVAIDTRKILYWDNGEWYSIDLPMNLKGDDIGAYESNYKNGYSPEYITDKHIANSKIGRNSNENDGGLKFEDDNLSVYANDKWNILLKNINIRQVDPNQKAQIWNGTYWIDMHTGNSEETGGNDSPLIQNFKSMAGAYQRPLVLRG